jgi:hypothetical protein
LNSSVGRMISGIGMVVVGSGAPGNNSSLSSRSSNCLVTLYSDSVVSWSARVRSLISGVSSSDESSDVRSESSVLDAVFLMNHPLLSLDGSVFFLVHLAKEREDMSDGLLYFRI